MPNVVITALCYVALHYVASLSGGRTLLLMESFYQRAYTVRGTREPWYSISNRPMLIASDLAAGSVSGVSHATAMTFGWLAGTIAATGEFPAEKTEIK